MLRGINRASNEDTINYLITSGFHQSIINCNYLVYLNHTSINPSKVTALFLDIYLCINLACSILIGGRVGKSLYSGYWPIFLPDKDTNTSRQFV